MKFVIFLMALALVRRGDGMNNGVARTPPMGWLAWERFRCQIDCKNYPDICIGEKLFMSMADRLVEDGWREAGYNIVHIDDCWSGKERNEKSELYPDPDRFPSGMKKLADYMHERGLKLGIYGDYGTKTCEGYPGSMGYEKIDAKTFAAWGVDMLKFDGCNSNGTQKAVGYPLMSRELNATGRPIIYSCSWPITQGGLPPKVNYTLLGEICDVWRNYDDIQDSFLDVIGIINWFGEHQDVLIPAAGPGKWNDPDMLIAGDFSLSFDQTKLQFGMWAIMASPLFMSNDLRNIDPRIRKMLQNPFVLAVNQDPLGKQGRRVKKGSNGLQLWVRPLVGQQQAIAVFSTSTFGAPQGYSFKMSDLGIERPSSKYTLMDLFKPGASKVSGLDENIRIEVNPSGIVMLLAKPFWPREKKEFVEIDLF